MVSSNLPDCRYNPWSHAATLQLRIIVRAQGEPGGYRDPPAGTIVLDERLTQAERRCALARRLVHIESAAADPCPAGRCPESCHQAVEAVVARRLITGEDLTRALLAHEQEADQADEVGVDVATLRAANRHALDMPSGA